MVSWNTSPWTLLRSWSEQMDRMFDEMVRGLNPWRGTPVVSDLWATLQVPTVRTRRRNGGIEVVADLPGVDRKALEVSIDENVLTIAGERHDEEEQAHSGTASFAQRYGRFERTVLLPAEVDPEGAQATLRNGVLRVTLPVASHAQGRRINVRAE
jgi:HSP20 family protein